MVLNNLALYTPNLWPIGSSTWIITYPDFGEKHQEVLSTNWYSLGFWANRKIGFLFIKASHSELQWRLLVSSASLLYTFLVPYHNSLVVLGLSVARALIVIFDNYVACFGYNLCLLLSNRVKEDQSVSVYGKQQNPPTMLLFLTKAPRVFSVLRKLFPKFLSIDNNGENNRLYEAKQC